MDIAGVSTVMSMGKLQNDVGVSVLKMAMNNSKETAATMTEMLNDTTKNMELSANSNLGSILDTRV